MSIQLLRGYRFYIRRQAPLELYSTEDLGDLDLAAILVQASKVEPNGRSAVASDGHPTFDGVPAAVPDPVTKP